MEIALTIAVAVLSLLLALTILAYYRLRARLDREAKRNKPHGRDRPLKRLAASDGTPPADDTALEIPAALVGARWKEFIERLAPILETTPVELLRSALCAGLTGGSPITTEMFWKLDELEQESKRTPPSKPGRSRPH